MALARLALVCTAGKHGPHERIPEPERWRPRSAAAALRDAPIALVRVADAGGEDFGLVVHQIGGDSV